jgi:hypothetical protein
VIEFGSRFPDYPKLGGGVAMMVLSIVRSGLTPFSVSGAMGV